ncbi:MAG TPA: zinc ABC transporter substrate-binding protein [Thermomicrobiales bacterium]|nr:zinc ABC transporter substrate-binding protein [Thermomicrobiales bacterium]
MQFLRAAMLGALILALVGGRISASAAQSPSPDEPLQVIASFSILGDLVANVGGDAVSLTTLVRVGADAHTFEPTPADVENLAEADLIVMNGLGFETWLDDLYEAADTDAERVVVTTGLDLLPAGEGQHEEEGRARGESDPHVWHDVNNVVLMVEAIRDALVAANPANADVYRANADAYLAELEKLDAFIVEQVETLPEERRKLVTSHDTFGYFADRYGFEVIGTALGSASTEVADPSAREIVELVDEIRASGVPAIFAENVSNSALMEQIAEEAGVELAPKLYTDALGEPGGEAGAYIDMMRYNVTTIVEALGR